MPAWAKINSSQPVSSFQDVMSEQLAHKLHTDDEKRRDETQKRKSVEEMDEDEALKLALEQSMLDMHTDHVSSAAALSTSLGEGDSASGLDPDWPTLSIQTSDPYPMTRDTHTTSPRSSTSPKASTSTDDQHTLHTASTITTTTRDDPYSASPLATSDPDTENDLALAHVLQNEWNMEHNTLLELQERKNDGNSKVKVSLAKYRCDIDDVSKDTSSHDDTDDAYDSFDDDPLDNILNKDYINDSKDLSSHDDAYDSFDDDPLDNILNKGPVLAFFDQIRRETVETVKRSLEADDVEVIIAFLNNRPDC